MAGWKIPAVLVALAGLSCVASALEPEVNYMLQCMGCHTPDGSGADARGVPSFQEALWSFAAFAEGRRFLVQVPGSAQARLSDAELAELLNWMIQNLSGEARREGFRQFTAQEVAGYRRQPLVDVTAVRERLLKRTASSSGG